MLGIFNKELVKAPKELNSPLPPMEGSAKRVIHKPKQVAPQESLKGFLSAHSNAFSLSFADNAAALAFAPPAHPNHRLFSGVDDIYCSFLGSLNNLSSLNKQYGLSKCGNEALFVIEAYKTLRDRGPYPVHQVLKDLEGSFGFVLYDTMANTVFVSLSGDGGVKLFWGIASDGSVMISDDLELIKASCAKSFAPFPTGCMYHSEGGLMSFEHPTNKLMAMPRVDSEGILCGSNFKVDVYSKTKSSMPRVGSEANWAAVWGQEA
ncbi:stem-specific protein TSJT1 [Daucus carota subsp. sativus]|uniref:stem-specific protein TSJT1 n=1 Tax=Daucus carota subsp. sativus TaxID=79200 RepID=UPI0007B1C750|nr:PREDICTED: stem-specific protein TSJT1-like [Daucus carota subsp. sativus]